jgi:hypothetical protein
MNRFLIVTAAALLAFPMGAAEKPAAKADAKSKAAPAAKNATATAAPAAAATPQATGQVSASAPQPGDSPLVAAAKRSALKRQQKSPSSIITNESLGASTADAHITTTNSQRPIHVPASVPGEESAEVAFNRQRAEERKRAAAMAEATKRAEEKRRERLARAAGQSEEEGFLDDPAQQEHELEKTAGRQPSPQE